MFRTSTLARGVGLIAIVDESAKAHPPSLEIVDICLRATCPRVRVMGQTPELVGRQRREIINLRGEGRVANDRARRTPGAISLNSYNHFPPMPHAARCLRQSK